MNSSLRTHMITFQHPISLLVGLVALALARVAFATDGITCAGTVATLGVHGTDRVMLRLSGMNTVVQICNLTQTVGNTYAISPEQCKAVYSTLLTAHAMGKSIQVWFDNVQTGTSCTNFVSWELATARWVPLNE